MRGDECLCSHPTDGLCRGAAGEFVGGAQEEGAVFGVAGLVEAEHGEFVAGGGRGWVGALDEMFDGGAEGIGDAGDVAAQLAGTVGFPLGDGAAADVAGGGELILSHAAGAAEGADSGADGGGDFAHGRSVGEFC